MADILLTQRHGAVTELTLNRPEALNALSDALLAALAQALAQIADDSATRVVILRGAGRAFCAGHDLREMQAARQGPDAGRATFAALFQRCTEVMLALRNLPQPVIAQVHGSAAAAGCQLVASCDLAVAATDARFAVNGIDIGLFCSTPMVALSRAVPRKQAFEMLATGAPVDALRAREIGLINRIAAPDRLEAETRALAATLAAKPGAALRLGKRAFHEQLDLTPEQAYALTCTVMVENLGLPDTAEGIAAFLEKRPPDWHG